LTYTPLVGGTQLTEALTIGVERNGVQFTTPFTFFGVSKPECVVFRSGHIYFWNAAQGYDRFPNKLDHSRIAAYWWNLETDASSDVVWAEVGSEIVIEWRNLVDGDIPSSSPPPNPGLLLTFQIRLDTTTGSIEFRYAPPVGGTVSPKVLPRVVGLRDRAQNPGGMQIRNGESAGFVDPDGTFTAWPSDRYIRFDPVTTGGPPTIVAECYGNNINYGNNMMFGDKDDTVDNADVEITVDDPDGDPTSLTADIQASAGLGVIPSQWQSATAGVPYTLIPKAGNPVYGDPIKVALIADDGTHQVMLYFTLVEWRPKPRGSGNGCAAVVSQFESTLALLAFIASIVCFRRKFASA
jgi:hypothetical protein